MKKQIGTLGILILSGTLGAVILYWTFTNPTFRNPEGYLNGSIVLPIALFVAVIVWGLAIRYGLYNAAFWFVLALLGQAVALQLIEAGPFLHYQHYQSPAQLLTDVHLILVLFIGLQSAFVAIGIARRQGQIRRWLAGHFRWWQVAGVGAVFVATSATVTRELPIYLSELILASYIQLLNLLCILLVVWALPDKTITLLKTYLQRLLGPDGNEEHVHGVDWFVFIAAIWVIGLASVLSLISFQRHPHVQDEVAYLQQARFFASGVLTMPAPPVEEAFDYYLMQFDGERWYPAPPPGWPLMLSLGILVGAPWLINPILAGVNILLSYLLIGKLLSRRAARISILLLCLSPWFVFMGVNFMTHTFTLTCALIAALGVMRARESGRAFWAWLAGGALGVMSLIRPLEGLIMAVLLGLWAIGLGGRRLKLSAIAGLVLGAVIVGGLVLPYNQALTGDPTTFPINVYTDQRFAPNANAYGFGPDRGMGWPIDPNPGHSPIDGLLNANLNAFSINIEMFGWATGSLILVSIFLFTGRFRKYDWHMLAVIAIIFTVYFFYYFSGGPDFGARYWYLMIIPLVVLTVRGIYVLQDKLADLKLGRTRVLVAVLMLSALALLNYFPWRAADKYHHYLNMRPDIRSLAESYDFGESLVFVRGNSHPDYASAAIYNPLDLQAAVPIYAWDRGPEIRAEVIAAYPDRPVWLVNGPTITRSGYEVAAGPLSGDTLLADLNQNSVND